jgi:predicted enzyme related to lactoylglutathione lyase
MKRVTGIGGIFFSAKEPDKLSAWYKKHLGIDVQEWGGAVFPRSDGGTTTWSVGDGSYFKPGKSSFMINYRVEDLRALIAILREEGCEVLDNIEESEYGIFGWVLDPEGNKVELWQPPEGQ